MENHYVPQFYLKRWAGNDKKLFVYRRPFKKVVVEKRLPVQVGFAEDLYTIPFVPADLKYSLETVFFKKVDQEGSNALHQLENKSIKELSQNARFAWAVFLVSMLQRHPIRVARLAKSFELQFEKNLDEKKDGYLRERAKDDMTSFEDFKAKTLLSEDAARQKKMVIKSGILLPQTINWIENSTMAVLRFTNNHSLLTSDQPVIITKGLNQKNSHIAVPIGPSALFIAAPSEDFVRRIVLRPRLVSQINEIVVNQAEEYVFGADPYHLKFVEARLKHSATQQLARRGS